MSTTARAHGMVETALVEHIREMVASVHGVADLQEADGAINAVAEGVADALLTADGAAISAAASGLRAVAGAWQQPTLSEAGEAVDWAEERGRLYGIVDVLRWVLQRRSQETSVRSVEPGSHAHRMLELIKEQDQTAAEFNSGAIAQRLDVDKTQVSRTGRDLIGRGLATATSLGRKTFWELTPRGRYALDELGAARSASRAEQRFALSQEPLALSLGDVTDKRAEEVANTLADRHGDITVLVFSRRAAEAPVASGSRRQPVPVLLIQSSRRGVVQLQELTEEVAAEFGTAPMPLSAVRASNDGRVVTILAPAAAVARSRRRGVPNIGR